MVSTVWFATKMRLQTCLIIPFIQAGQELKAEHPMRRKEYNGKEDRRGANETRTKNHFARRVMISFLLSHLTETLEMTARDL